MNLTDIANIRLRSHQITGTKIKTVKDMVGWMGAMQAQDYEMVKWAIGVRLPSSTIQVVETAINNGEIIRTHLLRPTWHIVSVDDIYWMLELAAPRIKALLKSRHEELELSEAILKKSNAVLEKVLSNGMQLTREELIAELERAGIATSDNRASHFLAWAELDGLVCGGAIKGGKPTYALLEERVPKTRPLTKEAALANLARKYFTSHCPATLPDFTWWSGLSANDAKQALEMVKSDFVSDSIGSQTYWLTNIFSNPKPEKECVYLLPAFDEFIISYKDRSAALPFENHNKAVSNNGIFRPVIVVNGQVIGIWKRTIKKGQVLVETEYFEQPNKTTKSLIEESALPYGHFLEKSIEINPRF